MLLIRSILIKAVYYLFFQDTPTPGLFDDLFITRRDVQYSRDF